MKATITGIHGFIGSALNKRLLELGWETFSMPRRDADYMFLFGSPSSDYWFRHAPAYSMRETVDSFLSAAEFCQVHGIRLIYPSSGTVYTGETMYSRSKKILELLAKDYHYTLGLRIFAGYGEGEGHKGDYASIVYQFTKLMSKGERPVIWGDGKQTRDFIYINDIVETIIANKDRMGVMDVGTGVATSFNGVVDTINTLLSTHILPIYLKRPKVYVTETLCKNPITNTVGLSEGILRMLKHL